MQLTAYIRVSRVGGRSGDSFISPTVQRERIEGYAKAKGHTIAAWHEDLDVSGGVMKRPGFDKALEQVISGETDGLIVMKLDRFARSLTGALDAIKTLDEAGRQLISVADDLDTSTPTGRFARTIMLALAELQREQIKESWQTAQQHAVARGVHISSKPPTGYDRAENGRLVPNVHAPRVTAAYEMRLAGANWPEIAAYLEGYGVVHPYGQRWTSSAARNLLTNRVYLGEARSGEYTHAGRARRSRPRSRLHRCR